MRIGILTYALDRAHTGISRYTVELVRGLYELRHEHHLELVLLIAGGPGPLVVH